MLQQSWNVLKSIDMNDKRVNKSSWIDAPRGFWFSQSWRKKPRTLKPRRCQTMHAPQFAWLESNFALTDGGARSFPVEVEELPAERCWDAVPASSESRRGRNKKRTLSPSLPPSDRDPLQILLLRVQLQGSTEQVSCKSCSWFPLFHSIIYFKTAKAPLKTPQPGLRWWKWKCLDLLILCLGSLSWKLHLNLAYLFVCFGLPLSLKSTGGK